MKKTPKAQALGELSMKGLFLLCGLMAIAFGHLTCLLRFRKAIRFRMLHYFPRGIWLIILFLSGIRPMVFWY